MDLAEIAALRAEVEAGRNPKDAKVALAKEITARFHSAAAAETAEQDFINRSKGGVPDEIPEVSLSGAPLGIGQLLKQANLAGPAGFVSMEDGAVGGFIQRALPGAEGECSVIEMGGFDHLSQETRATEASVRGFWHAWRGMMET